MKKTVYKMPSVRVVRIQQTKMLMASDGKAMNAERSSYGEANEQEWD